MAEQRQITEAQKKLYEDEYVTKWKKIAFQTGPVDKQLCIEKLKGVAKDLKISEWKNFIFTRSPIANLLVKAICVMLQDTENTKPASKSKKQTLSLYRISELETAEQIIDECLDIVINQCYSLLENGSLKPTKEELRLLLASNQEAINNDITSSRAYTGYGNFDAGWASYYDFFRNYVGLKKETAEIKSLLEYCQVGGWFLPTEDTVFIADFPSNKIHLDEGRRFHSLTTPVVEWADGFKVYNYHNMRIAEDLVLHPEKITVKRIEAEQNVEIRRVMTEIYGIERYIKDSGAEKIHKDEFGTLYKKEQKNDIPILMVEVINSTPEPDGTYHTYFIRVQEECRPLYGVDSDGRNLMGEPQDLTARNAVASTFGKYGHEYAPDIES